jgi:hypothetical protein
MRNTNRSLGLAVAAVLGLSSLTLVDAAVSNSSTPTAPALGQGRDPDAPPVGRPLSPLAYFNARAAYERMRIGDIYAGGHGNLRVRAVSQLHAAEQAQLAARNGLTSATEGSAAFGSTWTAIGPNGLPNGQTFTTPAAVSGRATSIAIDPTDANIVYIGAANGGVFRTTNGGTTWTPIFDQAASLAIGALALAPSDHTKLYVGTGEGNNSGDSYGGLGLYRIDNAPTTASLVGPINPNVIFDAASRPAFRGASVNRIIVSPTDPATIFVATTFGAVGVGGTFDPGRHVAGLLRSTNATAAAGSVTMTALQWPQTGALVEPAADVAFAGADANTLLLSVEDDDSGTAHATDDGVWKVTNALTTPTFTHVMTGLLFSMYRLAVNGTTAYAYGEGNVLAGDLRVSQNSGDTWSASKPNVSGLCGGQCWYDDPIAVDPANAQHIILGGSAESGSLGGSHILLQSSNGGDAVDTAHEVGLHADEHAIAFAATNPSGQHIVWTANDGGVFKSIDGGQTWVSQNTAGLNTLQFESVAVHPTDPNFTIGGTQDNGTEMHTGPGAAAWTRADFGDGGYALIDQHATDTSHYTLYHTYFNQTNNLIALARFTAPTDGSAPADGKWTALGCGGNVSNGINCGNNVLFYAPMALGPGVTSNTVYFGTSRLYRSSDKGTTMTVVNSGGAAIDGGTPISSIAIAPSDDNERLVGFGDGRVFLSQAGGNFAEVSGAWPKTQTDGEGVFVASLAIDPSDPNRAYVALGDYFGSTTAHVWTTANLLSATPTWTASSGLPDVPVNSVVVDPKTPANVFAGTDVGVFSSINHGATWQPLGAGLPVVPVFQMVIVQPNSTSERLRIATHGRGMWDLTLSAPTLSALTISPSSKSLVVGKTQQFAATGHYSDGSTKVLTKVAQWSSSNKSAATVAASGVSAGTATGKNFGTAIIKAVYGGKSVTATLKVHHPAPTITSMSPTKGKVGAILTIHGTNFFDNGKLKVTIGGVTASVVDVKSATKIVCTVPKHAKTGQVVVTTDGGSATSTGKFKLI